MTSSPLSSPGLLTSQEYSTSSRTPSSSSRRASAENTSSASTFTINSGIPDIDFLLPAIIEQLFSPARRETKSQGDILLSVGDQGIKTPGALLVWRWSSDLCPVIDNRAVTRGEWCPRSGLPVPHKNRRNYKGSM